MLGLDAADEGEAALAAAGAAGRRTRGWRRGSCCISGSLARREEQLEAAQGVALGGVEEPEGADAVHAAWRHVLQEAAQHLVGWEGEDLVPVIARVAVAEGDGVVVHREERALGHRGAVA